MKHFQHLDHQIFFADCAVEFSLANTKISESSPEGLLKALTLGSTKMYAKAVGVDKITDKKISYSEDEVTEFQPCGHTKLVHPLPSLPLRSRFTW